MSTAARFGGPAQADMRWLGIARRRSESLRADRTEDLIRRWAMSRENRDVASDSGARVADVSSMGQIVSSEPYLGLSIAAETPELGLVAALSSESGVMPDQAVADRHLERMSLAVAESRRALPTGRLVESPRLGVSLSLRPWVQQARPSVRFAAALAAVLVWAIPAMAGIGALPVPAQRLAHTVAGPLGFPSPVALTGGDSGSSTGAGAASATSLDGTSRAGGEATCETSTKVEAIRAEVTNESVWVWVIFTGPIKGDPQVTLSWVSGRRSYSTQITMTADLPLYLGASTASPSLPSNARVNVVACGGSVRTQVAVVGSGGSSGK